MIDTTDHPKLLIDEMVSYPRLENLRWGGRTRVNPNEGLDRILDAACACSMQNGLVNTTMDDIAAQAKVTRPTVYRYVGDRQSMWWFVVVREVEELFIRQCDSLRSIADFGEYLVQWVDNSIRGIVQSPILKQFLAEKMSAEYRSFLTSKPIIELTNDYIDEPFVRAQIGCQLRESITSAEVANWVNHITYAYLCALPFNDDSEMLVGTLRHLLRPAICRDFTAINFSEKSSQARFET